MLSTIIKTETTFYKYFRHSLSLLLLMRMFLSSEDQIIRIKISLLGEPYSYYDKRKMSEVTPGSFLKSFLNFRSKVVIIQKLWFYCRW
jgi:hypothetical protein